MLNLFEDLKIDQAKLHEKYILIKNYLKITGEQSILNDWVIDFQDRDNKIVKEFQTTFHSAFWEFYLYAVFKEAGFEIDFSKNRPDFIVKKPFKIYIEAVVANIKQGGVQENQRKLDDILTMIQPHWLKKDFKESMFESITRYSSAILSKSKKYTEYSTDKGFEKAAPYVVALSGYEQINYGSNFYYAMLTLLYGQQYDNTNDKYNQIQSILKPNTESSIPVGIFLNNQIEHISAIIFSCTLTLGKLTSLSISQNKSPIKFNSVLCIRHDNDPPHFKPQIISPQNPEYLSDGIFIFHNPFSINPLPEDAFSKTNAINVKFDIASGSLSMEGNNLPIVSRLNLAGGEIFINSSMGKIIKAFNPDLVFCAAQVQSIRESEDTEGYYVKFTDIENKKINFTLTFSDEKFSEYKVKKGQIYQITYQLPKNKKPPITKDFKLETYQNLCKIQCLLLDCGHIIDLQKIENT